MGGATTLMGFIGSLSLIGIGCPSLEIDGMNSAKSKNIEFNDKLSSCNSGCTCSMQRFSPICTADGSTTYFSPCHAGCLSVESSDSKNLYNITINNSLKLYNSCSCVRNNLEDISSLT